MTTILAVDDSATMRKCLEITFSGSEFELVTVDSAEAALEKVKTLAPALVITDVSLPPNDGYELCSTIKLAAPQLPVLMLASKQNPFDPTKGAQADGHIDKPFDTQVLQDKARALVQAGASGEAAAARAPQAKPVAMPERAPASGKIPAPRRKRPTPAMMAKPEVSTTSQPSAANVRRTVPFAMPGASKRPEVAGEARTGTQPMGAREQAASQALGPAARRQSATPAIERHATPEPAPARAPVVMSDTLPGVVKGDGAPSGARPSGTVALPAETAATLEGKLEGLGLTQDQVNGVLALSRDLVEQVVWEVVPVLAETLIKEEIRRLTKE